MRIEMLSVMSPILSVVFINLIIGSSVSGAKILAVFSAPSISHQVVFRPFTQELAKRGHEVTVVTADPAFPKGGAPENLNEIDVHDISYDLWSKLFLTIPTVGDPSLYNLIKTGYEGMMAAFEVQMKSEKVQDILRDDKKTFDLVVVEACVRPAIVLSYKYKTPLIVFSSFGAFHGVIESISGPFHPILYPDAFQHRLHDLSIWDEIHTLFVQHKFQKMIGELKEAEMRISRELFGPGVPDVSELANNVDMVFVNVHAMWDNFRPVSSNFLHLGGLPQKFNQELSKDLKEYLDSSIHGVIYVSFGSNVKISQIPKNKIDILIKVFSKLPYNVLFKWDNEEIPEHPKNLKLGKWFPQWDLLNHPNVMLFITQGGLQSTDEAIAAGVPMIGIPMIADQWFNIEQYRKFGIGVGFELETLTEDKLLESINDVIGNQSYRQNIARLQALLHDQPQTSLERAVFWAEHLLRHGGQHLHSPASNMPIAEFLELNLLAFILTLVLLIMFLIGFFFVVLRIYLRQLMRKSKIT